MRVRKHCGLFDGSTLGKIEVAGADASEFLDRLYLTRVSTLPIRRSRYAVLLREDGIVLDDGIVLRLAPDRFLATVSSSHADLVLAHMEFWRAAEFGRQDVLVMDLTDAWSVIVVSGPASRSALSQALGAEWRSTLAALKHMDFAEGNWNKRVLRVLRASFSGELAFEMHAHPSIALSLWERLIACGVTAYGLEAVDILRIEKGYLVSAEMNGQTTPQDLNLKVPADRNCIGSALLGRPGFNEPGRPRLVGVQSVRPDDVFFGGAQLVRSERRGRPSGYISSAAYSPELGRQVGLALVARRVSLGTELLAYEPLYGRTTRVRLTVPVHLDPAGERMKS
jgi:methylglutamate dehydrogenase subunit C